MRNWLSRKLSVDTPVDRKAMVSSHQCYDPQSGQPEQRVCVFENILLFNGHVIYISDGGRSWEVGARLGAVCVPPAARCWLPCLPRQPPSLSACPPAGRPAPYAPSSPPPPPPAEPGFQLPPIKISWLKKFEGDDVLHPEVLNRTSLPFGWEAAQVDEVEHAGLFHQTHYSNFYHMFAEVAPTLHNVLCRYLGDCKYHPEAGVQLIWIEEHRAGNPDYIMLDSIKDTFRCLTPLPVLHKDSPVFKDKVAGWLAAALQDAAAGEQGAGCTAGGGGGHTQP